jgi:hypothetical protein
MHGMSLTLISMKLRYKLQRHRTVFGDGRGAVRARITP